jgi:hypothetical protein
VDLAVTEGYLSNLDCRADIPKGGQCLCIFNVRGSVSLVSLHLWVPQFRLVGWLVESRTSEVTKLNIELGVENNNSVIKISLVAPFVTPLKRVQ